MALPPGAAIGIQINAHVDARVAFHNARSDAATWANKCSIIYNEELADARLQNFPLTRDLSVIKWPDHINHLQPIPGAAQGGLAAAPAITPFPAFFPVRTVAALDSLSVQQLRDILLHYDLPVGAGAQANQRRIRLYAIYLFLGAHAKAANFATPR